MSVKVLCRQCRKKFLADDRLRGKRVQCKSCGTLVDVSLMDEETAGAPDVPVLEVTQDSPVAPATTAAGANAAPAAPRGPSPSELLCPGCAMPVQPQDRICTQCGYSFTRGQSIKTVISAATQETARVAVSREELDYRGYRKNREFHSLILTTIEALLLPLSTTIFALCVVGVLVYTWVLMGQGYQDLIVNESRLAEPTTAKALYFGICAAITAGALVAAAAYYYIGMWFSLIGVRLAGRLLKFNLPNDEHQRMVATISYYNIFSFVIVVLINLMAGVGDANASFPQRVQHGRDVALAVQAILLPLFFGLQMFFFRLRFLENLVALLLQIACIVLLFFAVAALVVLIAMVYVAGHH